MDHPPKPRVGLTSAQVIESRRRHGANVLTPPPVDPWWREYLGKFDDPVIRILMVAAALAIAVGLADGRVAEGVGIIVAILLATGIAYWNERRAAREFDVLNRSNDDVPFKALRDSGYVTVPRRDVVVGDLIRIEVGEEVPADGDLVEAVGLQVSEARLTGESQPVDKAVGRAAAGEAYPPHRLLRGTTVVDGHALYAVSAVGDGTEVGRAARESMVDTDDDTPLNRQLAALSKVIGVVGLAVAALTFAALVGRGYMVGELTLDGRQWAVAAALFAGVAVALHRVWLPVVHDGLELAGRAGGRPAFLEAEGLAPWAKAAAAGCAVAAAGVGLVAVAGGLPASGLLPPTAIQQFLGYFMIAVTIIVVAVPEGLAMSVTLALAYSMRKMTASQTLVRRMHACETIGAATVICSDKTGTLTENSMRVAEAHFGPSPAHPGGAIPPLVAEAVAANTTAHLSRPADCPAVPLGNPTEGALLLWLDAAGIDYLPLRDAFPVASQATFSTERKSMATAGTSPVLGRPVAHAKGAPEVLLGGCDREWTGGDGRPLTVARRGEIETVLRACQSRGMRTLAFTLDGTTWLGFVAIEDPVRTDVPAAVAACRRAGVQVKIVTGDSPETAGEVARRIGLPSEPCVLGTAFAAASDVDAGKLASALSVLARARPRDKMRLVTLLKTGGHVVAVTGDGVNDGPALNHADVGLSMGKAGTAVAKEASDVVLLDDSFASVVTAIRWGRSLYANIQRFILFQLTINVAALVIALLGPFVGVALPLTVMQMLWINLIMDTFAALALATEPPDDAVMARPPRAPDAFIVTRAMAVQLFGVGLAFVAVLVGVLLYYQAAGEVSSSAPSRGGTIFFTLFVLLQFWNLFNVRCFGRGRSALHGLGANPAFVTIAAAILIGQVLIVQFGGGVFRTVPLAAADWAVLLSCTSLVLWVAEAARMIRRVA